MKKTLILAFAWALTLNCGAQTSALTVQDYGKVDKADLEMTTCDFEKDANAEILFDKGNVFQDSGGAIMMERHTRLKIFNESGKGFGSVKISYGTTTLPSLKDVEAETFNMINGELEITKLDPKLIIFEKTDKYHSTMIFAMPAVKAGSIIEWRFKWHTGYYPNWYFQNNLPTRYSEIRTELPILTSDSRVRVLPHVKLPYVVNIGKPDDIKQTKAVANVHSLPDESFMGARQDNLERMEFWGLLTMLETWKKVGQLLMKVDLFGGQFQQPLSNEGAIIKQAKALKTDDAKIAFIFNEVKSDLKWNDRLLFYSLEGIPNAWDKKSGNSGEINMIVYRLLKKSGINAYPMLVSTKKNGKINPFYPNVFLLNSMVVYIPVDSTKSYVLDASNKFNLYNTIPTDELNTFGLSIDPDDPEGHKTVYLENNNPVIQSVFLNAEITAQGKMAGTADITSDAYNKTIAAKKYKTDGEAKYIEYLTNKDNNLKVSSIKIEDMETDSVPLTQKIKFSADLTGSDENYIFFNTNFFSSLGPNPFTNEIRFSDIDFGYRDNYSINGVYKLPAGYAVSALPKNAAINIADGSMLFRRTIAQGDGVITVRYVLNHKKTIYYNKDYAMLREFYKQMYDLLNEQIVLKKA